MILFNCKCGEELEAAEDEVGDLLMCPICKRSVIIPRKQEAQAAAAGFVPPGPAKLSSSDQAANVGDPGADTAQALRRSSGKGIASLVLGIMSFFLPVLLSIPAIIVGVLGLVEIRRSKGRLGGTGLAIAGIACGILTPVLVVLLIPVVQNVRDAAANKVSQNNLKQIALALQNYHDVHKAFPQQAIYSADGRPLLSWRVAILGYIEAHNLYLQFKLDEPWDSPHNFSLISHMPPTYRMLEGGTRGKEREAIATVYQGFVGKNTLFRASHLEKVTLADITDGVASTLAVVEAAEPVPWTKPEDLLYDPDRPLPKLGGHMSWGFNAALVNGSVVRIDPKKVGEQTLRNAITINDGHRLGPEWPSR